METPFIEQAKQKISGSISLKLIVLTILALLLLIPTSMIEDIINEREYYRLQTESSISNSWGGNQQIMGPFLTVPYTFTSGMDKEGNLIIYDRLAHFTPKELRYSGPVSTEIKSLGIYDVVLYKTSLQASGYFELPDFEALRINTHEIKWEEAYISMGITDQSGIRQRVTLNWNEEKVEFHAGLPETDITNSGVHAQVALNQETRKYNFGFQLDVNGYESLRFIPVAEQTTVHLESEWPDPGFTGSFLPEHDIKDNGFTADWNVFHLSRNIPSHWIGERHWETESSFGVNLVQMVDQYQKNTRSVKYAFLIICLTFLTFFLAEIIRKKPMHPFQYIMAGMALVIFYALLLSITEHLGFDMAYLISSLLTGTLIVFYISAIFRNRTLSAVSGLFFLIVYSFIYVILQLEDFSLLVGSAGLFIALAVTMYLTRNIDWYRLKTGKAEE